MSVRRNSYVSVEENKIRFNTVSWAILNAALLLLALGLAHSLYRLSLPADGWFLNSNESGNAAFVFSEQAGRAPTPLRAGDELLAIEGRPVEAILADAVTLQPRRPSDWRAGHTVQYTVRRAAQELVLDVPLAPISPTVIFFAPDAFDTFRAVAILALMLLIMLGVFLRRPHDRAARLLFLLFVMIAVSNLTVHRSAADMFYRGAFWPGTFFGDFIWWVPISSLMIHLFLSFPVQKGFLQRYPRPSLLAIYGLLPLIQFLSLGIALSQPRTFWRAFDVVNFAGFLAVMLVMVLSLGQSFLTVRDPAGRAQLHWVGFGLLVGLGGPFFTYMFQAWGIVENSVLLALGNLLITAFPLSLAVAILRYRLWDIDPLINRTLVYGALSAVIIAVYAVVVAALGALFQTRGSFFISLVAAGAVAVLFQPLRERLQRGVNRLMYGERDDPYRVISRLSNRLAPSPSSRPGHLDELLLVVTETVRDALRLPYVEVRLREAGAAEFIRAVSKGTARGQNVVFPLVSQNEVVGQLVVAPRGANEPLSERDQQLLTELARQASTVIHASLLYTELQQARARLVTMREEERRRIRRDLHDGLGPLLASLVLEADTARDLVRTAPAQVEAILTDISEKSQAAIADVRRLVYGLRPPALDELGLLGAIRLHIRHTVPRTIHVQFNTPDNLCSLPAAVEVACFRIIQEAVNNVVQHACTTRCTIGLHVDEELHLTVTDDGRGMPSQQLTGVGLHSMRERALELGGSFTIEPRTSRRGTHVRASLPLSTEE